MFKKLTNLPKRFDQIMENLSNSIGKRGSKISVLRKLDEFFGDELLENHHGNYPNLKSPLKTGILATLVTLFGFSGIGIPLASVIGTIVGTLLTPTTPFLGGAIGFVIGATAGTVTAGFMTLLITGFPALSAVGFLSLFASTGVLGAAVSFPIRFASALIESAVVMTRGVYKAVENIVDAISIKNKWIKGIATALLTPIALTTFAPVAAVSTVAKALGLTGRSLYFMFKKLTKPDSSSEEPGLKIGLNPLPTWTWSEITKRTLLTEERLPIEVLFSTTKKEVSQFPRGAVLNLFPKKYKPFIPLTIEEIKTDEDIPSEEGPYHVLEN
ncbi:MAG: hypothetical protein KKA99_01355 [Gammaproteobacteria bacterium]|nr:hypothetical protein [Gammaproteobacteria bacterium]MBU1628506.1 hypothetical protein [Gammaproteobacteria bacterium]MBU1926861.1 hypothetical protein [Gammaproteobacteria bacterium]MBU2546142.1 hypothetical protein [Gammaproteobacteria bacterium]